jgi:branched-chain amino acid transport system substrate-binding protein
MKSICRAVRALVLLVPLLWGFSIVVPARAAEPVRIGFSMALTGGTAAIGKQVLLALEIWRDDVNATGGLLGRPVALVYYDDQSNPANVPGIYTKLIDVDKVDLVIGPYATNMTAAAIPVLMQRGLMTIGITANAANSEFHYPRYFSMNSTGPDPKGAYSVGFLELASAQYPPPKTIAILGADAEFGRNASDGARVLAPKFGLNIVYDRSYPPTTTDFSPILRAVQATKPDVVYVASYPPDSVGIVRAANEIGLDTKILGGPMIGLTVTSIKEQLGPLLNGIVNYTSFLLSPELKFPGIDDMIAKYQARAAGQGVDPLGYTFPAPGYAAGQVLAQAVAATQSLDPAKLAAYLHADTLHTIVGDITFGADGEWTKPRGVLFQFQHIVGNGIDQFKGLPHEKILWPAEFKTGELLYPYTQAKK